MQNNTEEPILRCSSVFLPLSDHLLSFNFSAICVPRLLCLLHSDSWVLCSNKTIADRFLYFLLLFVY